MRILANFGSKTNGDMYSVTFETMGDVPTDQAPQAVDELFRLAKEAVQRQLRGTASATPPTEGQPTPQAHGVTIPQPVLSRVEGPVVNRVERPAPTAPPTLLNGAAPTRAGVNGNGKPQIKDPGLPATLKQLNLLKRLAHEKRRWIADLTDLTMGEASAKIDELQTC